MKKILITAVLTLLPFVGWAQNEYNAATTTAGASPYATVQLDMDKLMSDWRVKSKEIAAKERELHAGTLADVNYSESLHGESEKDFTYKSVTQYKASLVYSMQNDSLCTDVYNQLKRYSDSLKEDKTKKDVRKVASMHMREVKTASKLYKKQIKTTNKIITLLMKRYDSL